MIATILVVMLQASVVTTPCASDTTDVSQFLTTFATGLPRNERFSRGAFVLVCGRELRIERGFGASSNGKPISTDATLFRAASNSKLITATAAMQLAEAGRWKLSDPVNRYLPTDAQVADPERRPVTIADLLTHTSGVEDKFDGAIGLLSDGVSLARYFKEHKPFTTRIPGDAVSYSNIGVALLGYAVESASGEPFGEYARKHIFVPLGMTHSTFAQPLPNGWDESLATQVSRSARSIAFEPYPAASLVTSPADMGRFIAANLSGGDDGMGRILSPASVAEMHSPHWSTATGVAVVDYGFFEGSINGHRVLFHTGDSGDHSVVFLVPDMNLGIYFVYAGSDEQTSVRERLVNAFMQRYAREPVPSLRSAQSERSGLAGRYRGIAFATSNYEKLKAIFNQLTIDSTAAGLTVHPPGGAPAINLVGVSNDTFRGDSGEVLSFRRGADGRATSFTLTGSIWDPQTFERIGFWKDGRLHVGLFLLASLVLIVAFARTIMSLVRARIRHTPVAPDRDLGRAAGWLAISPVIILIASAAFALLSHVPGPIALPRALIFAGLALAIACTGGIALLVAALVRYRRQHTPNANVTTALSVGSAWLLLTLLLGYWRVIPM